MNIKIDNYSVDNINWFKEHEGLDAFQCDILYDNKKIGFFSESYMAGPDDYKFDGDYDSELKKLRESANNFFKKYSSDTDLVNNTFNSNEDFLIRFMRSLKEASKEATEGEEIHISTSYPFDYEIKKCDKLIEPTLYHDVEENRLIFSILPLGLNLQVSEQENDYGLC